MAKKQKKVNFAERRYPKISQAEAKKMRVPDEVFWPVYYGMFAGGIYNQLPFRLRWHVIQCLEDGFKDDDAGLLQARKKLAGVAAISENFSQKHKVVLASPIFWVQAKWMWEQMSPAHTAPSSEWSDRAKRADEEFKWYLVNQMEEFHKAMEFSSLDTDSSFYMNYKSPWSYLIGEPLAHPNLWKPLPQGRLQGLDFNVAYALVDEHVKQEGAEIGPLISGPNKQLKDSQECIDLFVSALARERAAYVKAHWHRETEDKEKGHTNFGLDIDVPSLPALLEAGKIPNPWDGTPTPET